MSRSLSSEDNPPLSQTIQFVATTPGERLDRTLVDYLSASGSASLSRAEVQRLIKAGDVLINGAPAKASYRIEGGEMVTVRLAPPSPSEVPVAESIPLSVLYEDADLIAIDKPAGMVVHPATRHQSGTLVNAALGRWPALSDVGDELRSGVVHRLDKDTSGVIVLAKTQDALVALQAQFRQRTVRKLYLALVEGVPESSEGIIDAPIGRDPRRRKRMAVVSDGRPSRTHYRTQEAIGDFALLEIRPETGRTHQVRVHLHWLGHPIVGDRVYGRRKQRVRIKRHWLHAAALTVRSPSGGQELSFEAPLPSDLEHTLTTLRRQHPH